jgi:hypothetical protein
MYPGPVLRRPGVESPEEDRPLWRLEEGSPTEEELLPLPLPRLSGFIEMVDYRPLMGKPSMSCRGCGNVCCG